MRVVVTGGAGFIGSHVTDALAGAGHEVLVVDNLRTGRRENIDSALATGHVRLEVSDVLDGTTFHQLVGEFEAEVIVHLAALVSVQEARKNPDLNFQLNLEATQRVINAAVAVRVRRVVFASSAAVYGDNPRIPLVETECLTPLGLYGGAKAASELLLHTAGRELDFEAVSLRFFNVFGPRQRPDSPYSGVISIFVDRISKGLPVTIFGDGRQTRDFIAVGDVARAIAQACEAPAGLRGSFNVCTGTQTSLLDLVSAAESITGTPIQVKFECARAGDIIHSQGSPEALFQATGFRPAASFHDSLGLLFSEARTCRSPSAPE